MTVSFIDTSLTVDGQYMVTLKGTSTITDLAGNPLGGGTDQVEYFTLDTLPPVVTLTAPERTADPMPTVTVTATDVNGLPDGIPANVYTQDAALGAVMLAQEAVTWVKQLFDQAKGN